MISHDDALSIIQAAAKPLPAESCPAMQALDRILAAPVVSGEWLPPFDNSAMDGFALRAQDGLRAGTELAVAGLQLAGDGPVEAVGDAWEIMTGARMPDGFDAVVPVEQVGVQVRDRDGRPQRIRLEADVASGQHCRRRGEDVAAGQVVMQAGTRIEASQRMLLAAIGAATVAVVRRPRVSVIATGRELETDPGRPLGPGRIRDSSGPFLEARIAAAGAELVHRETVADDPAAFHAAVARALRAEADVVLSTGAVSMGLHDFVPGALRALGADIGFHRVAIRPGKPLLFARLPGGQLCFGLPGNPVASAVGLRFFVEPALRAMLGLPPEQPLLLPLAARYEKRAPLRFHLKGRLEAGGDGRWLARILPGQESFRILPMLQANAWIVLPEDVHRFEVGHLVQVHGPGHLDGVRLSMPCCVPAADVHRPREERVCGCEP